MNWDGDKWYEEWKKNNPPKEIKENPKWMTVLFVAIGLVTSPIWAPGVWLARQAMEK